MGKAENAIKDACIKLLRRRGFWVRNNPVGLFKTVWGGTVRIGTKGEADILSIAPGGLALWVETKTAKGKDEASQPEFAQAMGVLEIPYIKVRSVEELAGYLDGETYRETWRKVVTG